MLFSIACVSSTHSRSVSPLRERQRLRKLHFLGASAPPSAMHPSSLIEFSDRSSSSMRGLMSSMSASRAAPSSGTELSQRCSARTARFTCACVQSIEIAHAMSHSLTVCRVPGPAGQRQAQATLDLAGWCTKVTWSHEGG